MQISKMVNLVDLNNVSKVWSNHSRLELALSAHCYLLRRCTWHNFSPGWVEKKNPYRKTNQTGSFGFTDRDEELCNNVWLPYLSAGKKSINVDETVLRFIANLVKKVKSQMKPHFLDQKGPIFITGILVTFKLACVGNRIRDGAAMWVLPQYVIETLENALNSDMCSTDISSSVATPVRNAESRYYKRLQSNPEIENYILEKFLTDKAIAEFDAAILQYVQLAKMTPQQ